MTSQPVQKSGLTKFLDAAQPFWIGGLSGMMATCVIQPIDMIKVVIQLKSQENAKVPGQAQKVTFMSSLKDIYSKGGVKGFYRGLDSALVRQLFYTTTRLGAYKTMTQYVQTLNVKQKNDKSLSIFQKVYCAATAGFLGALVGNPPDLALVRMQADNQLPVQQRRNYKNVIDAFSRISKEEGFFGLWRGATPTIIRAMALNLAMLASYDEVKQLILKKWFQKENLEVRIIASMISGVLTSAASLPFDNAKTKIQKMKKAADGTLPYKNIFDAMGKTIKNEGFFKLWVGYPTFYARIAPHVCITLVAQDFLTDQVKKWRAKH